MNSNLNVLIKLNLEEGFLGIFDKLKRVFSEFLEKAKEHTIVLKFKSYESDGVLIELKRLLVNEHFREIKTELGELAAFTRDTEVIKIFPPSSGSKFQTLKIQLN